MMRKTAKMLRIYAWYYANEGSGPIMQERVHRRATKMIPTLKKPELSQQVGGGKIQYDSTSIVF